MIDKNIAVGRIGLTRSLHADMSFGSCGEIKSFNGLQVVLVTNDGAEIRCSVSGIALVCDTSEELSKLQTCDEQTYNRIRRLKQARNDFIKTLQIYDIDSQ